MPCGYGHNIRPFAYLTLLIFVISKRQHSAVGLQSHNMLFARGYIYNISPFVYACQSVLARAIYISFVIKAIGGVFARHRFYYICPISHIVFPLIHIAVRPYFQIAFDAKQMISAYACRNHAFNRQSVQRRINAAHYSPSVLFDDYRACHGSVDGRLIRHAGHLNGRPGSVRFINIVFAYFNVVVIAVHCIQFHCCGFVEIVPLSVIEYAYERASFSVNDKPYRKRP